MEFVFFLFLNVFAYICKKYPLLPFSALFVIKYPKVKSILGFVKRLLV